MNPLLVTLTGDRMEPELLGKRKRFFRLSKKGKKRAKRAGLITALAVAPVGTAAVLGIKALRKRSKKKKAQRKARAAEARKRKLEAEKRQAITTAAANPTPATVQTANTATIKAAAATAAANTAATEEYQAEQDAAEYDQAAEQAEDAAIEQQDAEDQTDADAATAADTGDYYPEEEDSGETMGATAIDPKLITALTPAASRLLKTQQQPQTMNAFVQKNKWPLIVFGAALGYGLFTMRRTN